MLKEFTRTPLVVLGSLGVVMSLLIALLGPVIAPADPASQDLRNILQPPSLEHPMGTDHLGRDVLSRLLWGARVSIPLSLGAVLLGGSVGLLVGLVAGYCRGKLDEGLMRLVDVLMCFPTLVSAIAVVAVLGGGPGPVLVAIAVGQFPRFARLARAGTLQLVEVEYVQAARALGRSGPGIAFTHVVPNMLAPMIVLTTLTIGTAMMIEASLTFLGLGIDPTTPTWGGITSAGLAHLRAAPWISGAGGGIIVFTVLSFNIVGDALADLWNPRLRLKS